MARTCPIDQHKALYLECQECEEKKRCKSILLEKDLTTSIQLADSALGRSAID